MLVPFDHFKRALAPYATADCGLAAYMLPTPEAPDGLRARVRSLNPTGIVGEGNPPDQVLNEELVAKSGRK